MLNQKTKPFSKAIRKIESLESRDLLTNAFAFDGGVVETTFDENNVVFVSQESGEYVLTLAEGVWSGTDNGSVTGAGTSQLRVDSNAAQLNLTGINSANVDAVFTSEVDFGTTDTEFENIDEIRQRTGSEVAFADTSFHVRSIALANPNNSFNGSVDLSWTSLARISATGTIEFDNLANAGRTGITASGSINVSSEKIFATNLRLQAGEDINLQSREHFQVGSLTVIASQNINVDANSNGESNNVPLSTRLGHLNFRAGDMANIRTTDNFTQRPSQTYLIGRNSANTLNLHIEARLADAPNTILHVKGDARIYAINYLWLGHDASNRIHVIGQVDFHVDSYISQFGGLVTSNLFVGVAGEVNFGSIKISGDLTFVQVFEDSTMVVDGVDVSITPAVFTLFADGYLFDSDGAKIETPRLSLIAERSVVLSEHETNVLNVHRFAVRAANVYIGGRGTTTNGLTYLQTEGVARVFEDDSIHIAGNFKANSAVLSAKGTISSASDSSIEVQHTLNAFATDRIFLGNRDDSIYVGGRALFLSEVSVIVGRGGNAQIEQVTYRTSYVDIRLQGRLHLVGYNLADKTFLSATDYISDGPSTRISSKQYTEIKTPKGILFSNESGDSLRLCGHVKFLAEKFVRIESIGNVMIDSFFIPANTFRKLHIDSRCN